MIYEWAMSIISSRYQAIIHSSLAPTQHSDILSSKLSAPASTRTKTNVIYILKFLIIFKKDLEWGVSSYLSFKYVRSKSCIKSYPIKIHNANYSKFKSLSLALVGEVPNSNTLTHLPKWNILDTSSTICSTHKGFEVQIEMKSVKTEC